VVGLVYHLDYDLPQMKGGKALRVMIEKMMVHAYDFALTISRSTADHLEHLGQLTDRIALIPVSRRFGPQPSWNRPIVETVTFLFVGSIEPRKGLRDAIEALSAYRGSRRIVFNCVGNCDRENAYSRELISAAEKCPRLTLNLSGAVSQQELMEFFRGADAFLFPSHWEGYGIAIEEAMCFALPVIAYDAGAVPELVENGATGWLAPLRDVDSLARSIAHCIDDSSERQRRGARGLAKATQTTEEQSLTPILEKAIAKAYA
jgi:glycosyltransferase involved in cell wall biosynthesis